MPLVSRAFAEACRDPALWPDLHVRHGAFRTDALWRGFLRWLSVRGSGLQALNFVNHWVSNGGNLRSLAPHSIARSSHVFRGLRVASHA